MDCKTKLCKVCGEDKDLSMFYVKQRVGDKTYLYAHCKACDKVKRQAPEYKAKNNERQRVRRTDNPQKFREYDKERRRNLTQEQKLRKAEYHRLWEKNNPEKVANYRPKGVVRVNSKVYYEKHKEQIKAKVSLYRKTNPTKVRALAQSRRRKESLGKLSPNIIETLLKKQKGLCVCCRAKLVNEFHLDHIVPLALGGTNTDDNVQLLTPKCNLQKNAKHPIDYMQERGYLL
jgi:hypothetical protein